MAESVRPSRVRRPTPTPTWVMSQQGQQEFQDVLTVEKIIPEATRRGAWITVEQSGQKIQVLPEFVEDLVDRLRAARDWEDG